MITAALVGAALAALALVALALVACSSTPAAAPEGLDYVGTYEGTIPAASSPGIKTRLTLNEDRTWSLREEYLEETDGVFESTGTFAWRQGGIVRLTGKDFDPVSYKLEAGKAILLGPGDKPVTGELADKYVLWKLDATSAATGE